MPARESASQTVSDANTLGVVVGFDGSPAAVVAADWGAHAAVAHKLPLTLLTARPDAEAPVMYFDDEGVHARLEEEFADDLDSVKRRVHVNHPDLDVHTIVHPGSPVEGLLEASESADMVVIGSRGLGGFEGLLLGSTAMEVTPYADCPVIVQYVPDEETIAARAVARHPDEVVVCYDGSPFAMRALMFGLSYAQACDLGVAVVYVSPGRREREPVAVSLESGDLPHQARIDLAMASRIASATPDVPVSYWHGVGRPSGILIRQASGAPLAVVGARGRGGMAQLILGSVGLQMLLYAECPMAMVHGLPPK